MDVMQWKELGAQEVGKGNLEVARQHYQKCAFCWCLALLAHRSHFSETLIWLGASTVASCLHRALDVLQESNEVHKGEQVKLHGNLSLVHYVRLCCWAAPRCTIEASASCHGIGSGHEVYSSWALILAGTFLRLCRLARQQTNTVPVSHHHSHVQRLELYQDALEHAQIMLELDPCWQVSLWMAIAQQSS